jgi:hypothetical protein
VITADLINTKGNRLILVGVLALYYQDGDTIDKEDNILPISETTVMDIELLGDLEGIPVDILIVDQNKIQLPVLLRKEELSGIPEVSEKLSVTKDIGRYVTEPPHKCSFGLAIFQIKFPDFLKKQIVKVE